MYEEIKAIYSRKNKELFLSIYDKNGNQIISSKIPKLIAYKKGEEVEGMNNNKYVVVEVEDDVFNPKKLHTAKMVRADLYYQE